MFVRKPEERERERERPVGKPRLQILHHFVFNIYTKVTKQGTGNNVLYDHRL
jgi:hypothetical protein